MMETFSDTDTQVSLCVSVLPHSG